MKPITLSHLCLIIILLFLSNLSGIGQTNTVKYDLSYLLDNNKLEVFNRKVSVFSEKDKKGIRFSNNENDGIAWLKHVIFSNGIIELDIRGKDEFQQSFVGVAFHGTDNKTFDAVYFRPFNFQSADSVHSIHAVQYISQPDYPWEVLREKFNGIYEKAVLPSLNANEWFHVRIIVNYPQITVFVNGNKEPSLSIEKLNNRTSGKIGFWVGNNSDGDFANLQIMSLN
jgi:Domain of Unknown Function (DUF1080)